MSQWSEDRKTMSPGTTPSPAALVAAAQTIAAALRSGGRLLVDGDGRAATDAHHVVVEFMHPVTVGKRAFPAMVGMSGRGPLDVTMSIAYQGTTSFECADISLSDRPPLDPGSTPTPPDGTHAEQKEDGTCWLRLPADDPGEAKVTAVLSYHLLWELTQLFLESEPTTSNENGAVNALYPMIYEPSATDGSSAIDEAIESTAAKIAESRSVRNRSLVANADSIEQAARLLTDASSVFTLGNGGSSTDAADAAIAIGPRARALTDDVATITALANDVSFDVVFARQLATLGRSGDCVIGFSTSGNSANVIEAAKVARRLGMSTVGLAGYDGGAMVTSGQFDVTILVSSESVHRIQEAQSDVISHVVAAQTT